MARVCGLVTVRLQEDGMASLSTGPARTNADRGDDSTWVSICVISAIWAL